MYLTMQRHSAVSLLQSQSRSLLHKPERHTESLNTLCPYLARYWSIEPGTCRIRRYTWQWHMHVFLDGEKAFNSPRLTLRLTKVCEKAGLRRITWHVLRHTFATHLAMNSEPLNTVQVLLGHSSIATTMRYAHATNQSLRSAIDRLNPKNAPSAELWQPVGNKHERVEVTARS